MALVAAGIATSVVLNTYRPLVNGSVFGVEGARFHTEPTYTEFDAALFRYEHGGIVTVKFGLRNSGRWPVTIERLLHGYEFDESMELPLHPERILTGPLITDVKVITPRLRRYRPFKPFTLEPGEERLMAIQFRFQNCRGLSNGETIVDDSYSVRHSTLGFGLRSEISYPYRLVIKGPVRDCPGRSRPGR